MMMLTMILSLSSAASAQDLVSCYTPDGEYELSSKDCLSKGGAFATCNERTCEVTDSDGKVHSIDTPLGSDIAAWGLWFDDNHKTDPNAGVIDPFDPWLLEPCSAWARLHDLEPDVCGGPGLSDPSPVPPGPDECPPHSEVDCAVCTGKWVACSFTAATLGPIFGGIYQATVCQPNWKKCIDKECGLDCV